jgi:hypothetical protein
VTIASKGLYRIDFSRFSINILTGRMTMDDFSLMPDTALYESLKKERKPVKSLYEVTYGSVTLDRLRFRQIYNDRRVIIMKIILDKPVITILGYSDSAAAKKGRFTNLYEDMYPFLSAVFTDIQIDSVKIQHGRFLSSSERKTGNLNTGEYEFSANLKDFTINPFSYYNKNRVFYSRDIELKIHDFEYVLADSLYFLRAEEVGFSLTKQRLYGKNLSLRPNFRKKHLYKTTAGDFFRLDLPLFSIDGINLYEVVMEHKVEIDRVLLRDFALKVYRNHHPGGGVATKRPAKKKISVAGLYTVIAGELKSVAVDTIAIEHASFEYYGQVSDRTPELRIDDVKLGMTAFLLDTLAHQNREKVFYAEQIELMVGGLNLALQDQIHTLRVREVSFSTLRKRITVHDAMIVPDVAKNMARETNRRNVLAFLLPELVFHGINLRKMFNYRVGDFDSIEIREPDLKYIRFHKSENKDPRFSKPKDFFEEENEAVVYNLLRKYVKHISGAAIRISKGFLQYGHDQDNLSVPVVSGTFDLLMKDFRIDSVTGMNQQGYFYSRDFDLDILSARFHSPDSLKQGQAERIHIATADSLIEAFNISFQKAASKEPLSGKKMQSLDVSFSLKKLLLSGLNHKKLFLDKIVRANVILLEKPVLRVKAESEQKVGAGTMHSGPEIARDFIHRFEIGRMIVRQGSMSYDGYEDRVASYFSLRDVDFGVLNAVVNLPEKGQQEGLIRFDSLQLSVFPFRAVVADSTYAIECRSLDIHSYPVNITARNLTLTPLKTFSQVPQKKMLITATIPELKITGFYFDKAIFDKRWNLDSVKLTNPSLEVEMKATKEGSGIRSGEHKPPKITLPPMMKSLDIAAIVASGGRAGYRVYESDRMVSQTFSGINLAVTHFRVDSVTRANPDRSPLLNADDIAISAHGMKRAGKDSLYDFSLAGFALSTRGNWIRLDSVAMMPRYSKPEFGIKLGHQADRMEILIPGILISGVDFRKLITQKRLHANKAELKNLSLQDYRDKRLPLSETIQPVMPVHAIRKITFPAVIDTISLVNGFAAYEEQTGDQPGRIFFDQMNFNITGFSTDTAGWNRESYLVVNGTTRMVGKAPVEALIKFPLASPTDSFSLSAKVGNFDLRDLNPMVSKLIPVTITRGRVNSAEIRHIHANNIKARGLMEVSYQNLGVRISTKGSDTWGILEQELINLIAELAIPDDNPDEDGKMRTGIIYFERDQHKGFFNFVWKSTLSGLKSSAGFNTKIQREIRRQEKKMKE